MKVLQYLPSLGYGGVERVVLNYAHALKVRGYTFDYITHGGVEDFHDEIAESGSRIFYLPPMHEVGPRRYRANLAKAHPESYEIVHVHTGHLTGVYGGMVRLLGQRSIVAHAHATRSVNPHHSAAMPVLRRLAVANSLIRLACGREAGDFCFGPGNYRILPNGLDFDQVTRAASCSKKPLQEELGLPVGGLLVGHVGRFTAEKNHSFAMKAFSALHVERPDARLLLVGDGPLQAEMQSFAQAQGLQGMVRFLGARDDVYALMHQFDVLLLPSLFEGLPVVVIEAQAAGTPCVVSDLVDHDVDLGLDLVRFVSLDSPYDWARAILQFAGDRANRPPRDAILERLRATGYEIHESAELLAQCYREALAMRA